MPFIKDIQKKVSDAKTSKTIEEKQWNLNLQFLEGRQQLSYDKNIQSYLAVNNKNDDLPTINLLLPLYRNLVSRLVSAYPGIVVMPASPTSDDIVKAQASEAALRYFWSEEDVPSLVNEMVQWLIPCGNVLLHEYYDPDKEKVVAEVIKPYDFYYERGVIEEKDARWIAIRRFYDKEDLIAVYPDKEKVIRDYADKLDEETSGPTNYLANGSAYSNEYVPPGKLEVFEIYDKKGNHGVILNDIWLFEGETPDKVYPCQHIRWTEIRNRIWGLSLLTPLLELQSYYNKARGQILDNVEMMANPKWLIPKNAGVAPNAISKRAGEKIFFNPAGGTPQQVSAAPIPAYVIDNIRQLQSEIMDVSGIHSSTLGKRTIGTISGKAIQELTSGDLSSLQMTQNDIENACKNMAQIVLVMMKAYYSQDRLYRMLDTAGKVVFRSVNATDIVDVPEVFIQANTLFQADAAEREARAFQLLEAGIITKEEAREQIMFRTSGGFVIEAMQGTAHAQEILEAVKLGAAVEIFATDDLPAFTKVINEFIRSGSYYDLPVERQDYIRDILVGITSYNAEDPNAAMVEMDRRMKVFPRTAPKLEVIATQSSPIAQMQQAGQVLEAQEFGRSVDALRNSASGGADVAMNEGLPQNGGRVA